MNQNIFDFLKITVPLAIGITLIYEISYFYGIGIRINNVPLGIPDVLRGWVEWSSILISVTLGFIFPNSILKRIEGWKSESEILATAKNPERLRKFRDSPYVIIKYSGIASIILFLLFGERLLIAAMLGLYVLGIITYMWVIKGSPIEKNYPLTKLAIIAIGLLVIFATNGFINGSKPLEPSFSSNVKVAVDSAEKDVVRIFDQWTLVKTGETRFSWIHHQSDRKLDVLAGRERFNGFISTKDISSFIEKWRLNLGENETQKQK